MTVLTIISLFCLQSSFAWGVPVAQQGFPPYGNPFGNRFPNFNFPNFAMPGFGQNSAFAGAALAPGYQQQVAAINPGNPNMPNVDEVKTYQEDPSQPHMYRVASSSYASSSNIDGVRTDHRGAHSYVDKDGVVSEYNVNN